MLGDRVGHGQQLESGDGLGVLLGRPLDVAADAHLLLRGQASSGPATHGRGAQAEVCGQQGWTLFLFATPG